MQAPFNELYSANLNAFTRLTDCSWRAWGLVVEQQTKLLGLCAECTQRELQLLSGNGGQKPAELLAAQGDIARRFSDQLAELSRVIFKGTQEAAGGWMSSIQGVSEALASPAKDEGGETEAPKGSRAGRREAA